MIERGNDPQVLQDALVSPESQLLIGDLAAVTELNYCVPRIST